MDAFDRIIEALETGAIRVSGDPDAVAEPGNYWHMGVITPDVRKLARKHKLSFAELGWEDRVAVLQRLLDYGSDEAAHLAVFLLGRTIDAVPSLDSATLDGLVDRFKGWSVTDAFCIEVLQSLLRRYPEELLALSDDWSRSLNRWKRRASVVMFVRKIGESGQFTELGLAACERLIHDDDDLVRKGVGWAIKDLMRGDRVRVLKYVSDLRQRGVPSVITLYALRDIEGPERQRILAVKP